MGTSTMNAIIAGTVTKDLGAYSKPLSNFCEEDSLTKDRNSVSM